MRKYLLLGTASFLFITASLYGGKLAYDALQRGLDTASRQIVLWATKRELSKAELTIPDPRKLQNPGKADLDHINLAKAFMLVNTELSECRDHTEMALNALR